MDNPQLGMSRATRSFQEHSATRRENHSQCWQENGAEFIFFTNVSSAIHRGLFNPYLNPL